MSFNPAEIRLSHEQQLFIAQRSQESGQPWRIVLDAIVPGATPKRIEETVAETAYDAFARSGFIGCCSGLPHDLATKPAHMNGFGE
jgi:hypothetical protein